MPGDYPTQIILDGVVDGCSYPLSFMAFPNPVEQVWSFLGERMWFVRQWFCFRQITGLIVYFSTL
jgi:hypothetical protein